MAYLYYFITGTELISRRAVLEAGQGRGMSHRCSAPLPKKTKVGEASPVEAGRVIHTASMHD